jgi:hypothetical protein
MVGGWMDRWVGRVSEGATRRSRRTHPPIRIDRFKKQSPQRPTVLYGDWNCIDGFLWRWVRFAEPTASFVWGLEFYR